ncbi:MAG TPA: hypothetical protein VGI72_09610 [Gaiellales bacterium]|jgi:hypothetical protein
MLRNVMTVKRGLLVGAAVGVAVVVLWRRSRETADVVAEPAPPERAAEPAVQNDEPAMRVEEPVVPPVDEPVVQAEEPVSEPQPPSAAPVATVAAPEPETLEGALAVHRSAAALAHRPVALTHVGRPRELGSAEWPQPRPVAALGSPGRTQTTLARSTWPGVAGTRRGAFTRGR